MKNYFLTLKATMVALALLTSNTWADAHDIEADGIYYNKTSENTLSVTYGPSSYNTYKGDVVIPQTVTSDGVTYTVTAIGDWAFQYCVRLTSVELPSTITSIGDNGFTYCTQLTHITLPEALTSIGIDAFHACMRIEEVIIPDNVTTIGEEAFYNCGAITEVVLGSGLQSMGAMAFGCDAYSAITSVTCRSTVPPVMGAENCFYAMVYSDATLHVPSTSLAAYQQTDWWNLFLNVEGFDNLLIGDVDGNGVISIGDLADLIDMILEGQTSVTDNPAADCDQDGSIGIADVVTLIDMILNS